MLWRVLWDHYVLLYNFKKRRNKQKERYGKVFLSWDEYNSMHIFIYEQKGCFFWKRKEQFGLKNVFNESWKYGVRRCERLRWKDDWAGNWLLVWNFFSIFEENNEMETRKRKKKWKILVKYPIVACLFTMYTCMWWYNTLHGKSDFPISP